jgi:hypothetical protein
MIEARTKALRRSPSPPLVPSNFAEMLQDAEDMLVVMGSKSLEEVAELARALSVSAFDAGAWEIAEVAAAVQHIASGGQPVVLAGAMRDLAAAVARIRRDHHHPAH